MKKRFPRYISLIFLALSLTTQKMQSSPTVLWHNLSDGPGGTSAGVTQDVVDCNIDVIGTNALVDAIHVTAQTVDIFITVTNGDAVITGSGNRADGIPTGPARLYLSAATSRTITFSLSSSLLFRGTANGSDELDLLVSVTGAGKVVFDIQGGQQVSFTSTPSTGGTFVLVGMGDPANPQLIFRRINPTTGGNINQNINILVGAKSYVSYIADAAAAGTGVASIIFDPSSSGTGYAVLTLQDGAGFVIRGSLLTVPISSNFLITDVAFDTVAGANAIFQVINPNSGIGLAAPLRIVNNNNILPSFMSDPFCDNAFTASPIQPGFILGPDSELIVNHLTYIDYIGTETNTTPTVNTPLSNVQPDIVDLIECGKIPNVQALIKERNASAFFVDGDDNPLTDPAQITFFGSSAIYFRSGVDCNGDVSPSFTIDPGQETMGAGNIVFDIEGELNVTGNPGPLGQPANSALNVLSLEVSPTGCSVFVETSETQFPQRTFARDADGVYLQYNKAAWLINNRMNVDVTSILHTDAIHNVFDRNTLLREGLTSEPTYIGGETFKICLPVNQQRPTIALYNSIFRVSTNVGLTGVDIRVPNDLDADGNTSTLRFYNNGRRIDNGYGRIMLLGTDEGSTSACGFPIDADSHLDVFQEVAQDTFTPQSLLLDVGANDDCITEGLTYDITGQCAVQTIFLNNASNISIGTNGATGIDINTGLPFDLVTTPSLCIAGDFFSFETAGGLWGLPETSGTTGQGGIFVDANGTIKINPNLRASFDVMVTKSRNGAILLPKSQVYFSSRVGITQWNINLIDPAQRLLIPANICLSDFTMDWGAITKDYVSSDSFVPYEPKGTPPPCECPPVTDANLRALPVVQGTVDQFQIKRSRIGDQMHLQVDGGKIKELVFLVACNSAEAPVGFLVVQNDAFVGIGTAHRNVDSLHASVKLGMNGLAICANGNATIELNENILVDNTCAILSGTSFGVGGPQVLTIHSQLDTEFRIKSTGVLDLSQFDNDNKILQFAGAVRFVCEPGARIILGGGTLVFTDQTQWTFERVLDQDLLAGLLPSDLDDIRVKLSGRGFVLMNEDASLQLLEDQFMGIETDPACDNITSITWILNGQAKINVGTAVEPGGALQIGNTQCFADNNIDVTFVLDGIGTLFQINRRGFVGFGVGVADKASAIPNEWLVNCLENVLSVSVEIREGTFQHNQIVSGDVSTAALFAVGPADAYTWVFDIFNARILGGGNFVLLENCLNDLCTGVLDIPNEPIFMNIKNMPVETQRMIEQSQALMRQAQKMMDAARQMLTQQWRGPKDFEQVRSMMRESKEMKMQARRMLRNISIPSLNPIVQNTAGQINPSLEVGILSGELLLVDPSKGAQPVAVSPQTLFTYLTTSAYVTQFFSRANIAQNQIASATLGFVDGTIIRRDPFVFSLSAGGFSFSELGHSFEVGAVGIGLDPISRAIHAATEIKGKITA